MNYEENMFTVNQLYFSNFFNVFHLSHPVYYIKKCLLLERNLWQT